MAPILASLAVVACSFKSLRADDLAQGADDPTQVSPSEQLAPAAETDVHDKLHDTLLAEYGGPGAANSPSSTAESGAVSSSAEQITRLSRSIQQDEERLEQLKFKSEDPMSEYRLAESAFKEVDDEFARIKAKSENLNADAESIAGGEVQQALEVVGKRRELARQRFDLAIESRKTTKDQVAALEAKLKEDRIALAKLTGDEPVESPGLPASMPSENQVANSTPPPLKPASVEATVSQPASIENAPAPDRASSIATIIATPTTSATETANGIAVANSPEPFQSQEVAEAQQQALATRAEAAEAETEAKSVADRIAIVNKSITLEDKLLNSSRQQADIALQARDAVAAEHEQQASQGAALAKLQQLAKRRRDSDDYFRKSRLEVRDHSDRLSQLQTQLAELQQDELQALAAADEKRQSAAAAETKLTQLQNPFSVHNMLQWLLDHGPRLCGILMSMCAIHWFVRFASLRAVGVMARRGARGSRADREDRAKTLAGVFHNAVTITVVVGGVLMICEELGIAVGPLMGGAAVFGLAVAFGAQNLIRDYFYGFVILLENQYTLNDVLRIGETAGQVEQITLRMTVLRDLEGHVHFIPNGRIESVTNMTHGWSRALFDIGVAYKEDVDHVMEVLLALAADIRRDPVFAPLILDDAEMLGVDAFGDSAVTIRFILKTRPLKQWAVKQWAVKRELLRRIKRRFDELGIEIPFPQRTVYHRVETGTSPEIADFFNPQALQRRSA
ncbi:MAG: mechanosensitive ion channel [Planctomycetia bacterium]|nr:mechanosensitive ion channel [Planctomycetia bacterium]